MSNKKFASCLISKQNILLQVTSKHLTRTPHGSNHILKYARIFYILVLVLGLISTGSTQQLWISLGPLPQQQI